MKIAIWKEAKETDDIKIQDIFECYRLLRLCAIQMLKFAQNLTNNSLFFKGCLIATGNITIWYATPAK